VVANYLGRFFVDDDCVQGFECAHGKAQESGRRVGFYLLVNHSLKKIRKTIIFQAFERRAFLRFLVVA
jgi:hypothetical protein